MTRFLFSHIVNEANDKLVIAVMDEPGAGGANHLYSITGFDTGTNPSCPFVDRYGKPSDHTTILFQNGPIAEVGVNGITHEALLAILADRLESFQAGPYASDYNAAALDHIRSAQGCLHDRTRARMAQGIEGTHAVGTESQDRSTDGIAAAIEGASEILDAAADEESASYLGSGAKSLNAAVSFADVEPILKFFEFEHLPEHLQALSRPFCFLARELVTVLPRNAERSVALRKLLEAKDAAVRARL